MRKPTTTNKTTNSHCTLVIIMAMRLVAFFVHHIVTKFRTAISWNLCKLEDYGSVKIIALTRVANATAISPDCLITPKLLLYLTMTSCEEALLTLCGAKSAGFQFSSDHPLQVHCVSNSHEKFRDK